MRARLVFNPAAGRSPHRRQHQLEQLCTELRRLSWSISPDLATSACDVVVVCGGDGTLHRVVNELARMPEPRPALAVAPPWGTANIYALALNVPRDPTNAARWLARAQPRPVAIGVAQWPDGHEQYFAAIASAGYDAAIVHQLSAEAKRRWGKLAFATAAALQWRQYFPRPLRYDAVGESALADGIMFGLTPYYAGKLRLGAPAPDGAIALALTGAPSRLPQQALALFTRGLEHAPGVRRLAPGPIEIASAGIPLELDGEPAGETPIRLSVSPAQLRMLVAKPDSDQP